MKNEMTNRKAMLDITDLALQVAEETEHGASIVIDTKKGTFEVKLYSSETSTVNIICWMGKKAIKDIRWHYKGYSNRLRSLLHKRNKESYKVETR